VRGASAAAGAIYSDREATRRDGTDKVIDRSVAALQDQGWTASQIHRLLIEWACRDDASVAVLIDLEAEGATEAIHELTCRYEAMHQELEFVSLADADELQIDEGGSTQVLCLRASGPSLGDVLARHASAVRCSASGPAAAAMLTTMWNSNRSVESSPTHAQRIRKMRRRELTDQFLARTLGR